MQANHDNDSRGKEKLDMQDMRREREGSAVDVAALKRVMSGGEARFQKLNEYRTLIERDPILHIKHFFDRDIDQMRRDSMKQIHQTAKLFRKTIRTELDREIFLEAMSQYDRTYMMRMYVHWGLFRENIRTHGTPSQWQHWQPLIESLTVFGCFAMTEMGHSSNLRGLETTATYNHERRCFYIHTPSLLATKVWIGGAGQIASHTVAVCQLIIDGVSKGLHWFIVPLRDRVSGECFPGVSCGDLGHKQGRNGLDNGWIQFTHYEIPVENMLMKWAKVDAQGEHIAAPYASLAYNTLISERLALFKRTPDCVGQCSIIAIRYGAIRRQGNENQQILDYTTHQRALFPILAGSMVVTIASNHILGQWQSVLAQQDDYPQVFLSHVKDWHGLAAGVKAWLGWWGADSMEICRRAMGGHGYSSYNAIAGHINDYGVMTTGGGDNIVMAQQSMKYLLGCYKKHRMGRESTGFASYFNRATEILAAGLPVLREKADWLSPSTLLQVYTWLSISYAHQLSLAFQQGIQEGMSEEAVWDMLRVEIVRASKAHAWLCIAQSYYTCISQYDPSIPILSLLGNLFFCTILSTETVHLMSYGGMTVAQMHTLNQVISDLCGEVRPIAISLTDAFDYPDYVLKSPLARYDGDGYQKYFDTWLHAPSGVGKCSYWDTLVKPMYAHL